MSVESSDPITSESRYGGLLRTPRSVGHTATRSIEPPEKIPGATWSPEASRALQAELTDIRNAEHLGAVGGDRYYIGARQQP